MRLSILSRALATAALMAAHAVASAATFTLAFDGDVASLVTGSFVSGDQRFDTGLLALDSMDLPITVVQGDEIDATITLINGPFLLPASPSQFFGLNFLNANGAQPSYATSQNAPLVVSGTYDFRLNGQSVYVPSNANCGNCTTLLTAAFPGSAHAFDSILVHLTFGNLTAAYTIDSATISYQLNEALPPVPEPSQWILLVAGLVGAAAWSRHRRT